MLKATHALSVQCYFSLVFPSTVYTMYTLFQCVCVSGFFGLYFFRAWAGSRPGELVLSEDRLHVGLCGKVKIEADMCLYIHTDTGLKVWVVFCAEWL